MRTIHFEKLNGLDPSVVHTVHYEFNYRQSMSVNGFFDRMTDEYLRQIHEGNEEKASRACWDRRMSKGRDRLVQEGCEEIIHKSVWDFYDYIGYDYKKSSRQRVVWKH